MENAVVLPINFNMPMETLLPVPQVVQIKPNAKKEEICGLTPTIALSVTPNANNAKPMPLLVSKTKPVTPLPKKDVGEPLPMELLLLAPMPKTKLMYLVPIKNLTKLMKLELPLP